MTKPIFGKWTRVEDGLPEKNVFVIIHVPSRPWLCDGSRGTHFYKTARLVKQSDSWIKLGHPEFKFEKFGPGSYDLEEVEKWMPLPASGQDAFTELRTLLDNYERNASEGKLQQFDDGMLFVIKKIREVIE